MSDQIEPGLTEEEVQTYNSALDSFIKLNANYVDFTEKSDGFTYITMRYGLAHDEVLRELALKCKNGIVDNSFVIGQFNWNIVYANSAILRFKCSTNTIATKIENDAKTDEVLFKSTTASYAENFDNDVAAYIKHYIINNATEPSNVNAELGFSFYKYGNKTHLGIDCAALNKYATSHSEDTVIVALNAVCINTIQYYADSPKTVTELLSNALAERKLSLEKVNSKVIIFGYNPDEDTGELETTEILEAWKQAQQGEPEDPNSGNIDPSDPGTGGNDDPNQGGDDPSGTQDEFTYEKTPGQITKIIVNYNVLEKNNETGKITFNDTFEPVNDNEFKVGKVHYSETHDSSGMEYTDEQNFEYITDSCDNTYFYCTNKNSNDPSNPSSVSISDPPSNASLAWINRLKRGSRKIVTSEKLLISVDTSSTETDIGESYNDYNGDSFSSKVVRNLLMNDTLKNTMITNYKIYYGLTSQNIEISDDDLSSFVLNHAYLGNENNVLYLREELKTTDSDVYDVNENTSYCPNKIKFDWVASCWGIDVVSELLSVPNFYISGTVRNPSKWYTCTNCIALRAHNTGTALNVFILDDIDRYFDENFDQNDPGTGGNDDPNSGNDDPSGTQDEFVYEKVPYSSKYMILHYGNPEFTPTSADLFDVVILRGMTKSYNTGSTPDTVEMPLFVLVNKTDKSIIAADYAYPWIIDSECTLDYISYGNERYDVGSKEELSSEDEYDYQYRTIMGMYEGYSDYDGSPSYNQKIENILAHAKERYFNAVVSQFEKVATDHKILVKFTSPAVGEGDSVYLNDVVVNTLRKCINDEENLISSNDRTQLLDYIKNYMAKIKWGSESDVTRFNDASIMSWLNNLDSSNYQGKDDRSIADTPLVFAIGNSDDTTITGMPTSSGDSGPCYPADILNVYCGNSNIADGGFGHNMFESTELSEDYAREYIAEALNNGEGTCRMTSQLRFGDNIIRAAYKTGRAIDIYFMK